MLGERALAGLLQEAGFEWNRDRRCWVNELLGVAISAETAAEHSPEEMCRWIETGKFARSFW